MSAVGMSAPPAPKGPWSAAEDEALRAMYATSESATIAAALGRSVSAVRNRCLDLGLNTKKAPWGDNEVAALREAYARADGCHLDLTALAARLGRPKTSVCRKARELGLTDQRRPMRPERVPALAERMRRHIAEKGHPRGALGLRHTAETKAVMGAKARTMWANPASAVNSDASRQRQSDAALARGFGRSQNAFSRSKKGTRPDLGVFFRSRWEANYARFLNLLKSQGKIVGWRYEARTFVFEAIKRGTRSYTPDFEVTFPGGRVEWHEVKGWLHQRGRTAIERFRRYYPGETLVLIEKGWFKSAARSGLAGSLPHWEYYDGPGTRGRR
jgi:hypothetical protein